jgi:RimJ/RimL family protein N-acetyltransferase
MTEAPILETDRLVLRPHRASDFDALHAMWANPDVYRRISGRPSRREESWARLLRYCGHWPIVGYGMWALVERETGQFIGEAGFADYHRDMEPPLGSTPEMGWVIDPSWHGQGYGREATLRIVEWGRAHLAETECACIISPENVASLALARRLGFAEAGTAAYSGDTVLVMRLSLRR